MGNRPSEPPPTPKRANPPSAPPNTDLIDFSWDPAWPELAGRAETKPGVGGLPPAGALHDATTPGLGPAAPDSAVPTPKAPPRKRRSKRPPPLPSGRPREMMPTLRDDDPLRHDVPAAGEIDEPPPSSLEGRPTLHDIDPLRHDIPESETAPPTKKVNESG